MTEPDIPADAFSGAIEAATTKIIDRFGGNTIEVDHFEARIFATMAVSGIVEHLGDHWLRSPNTAADRVVRDAMIEFSVPDIDGPGQSGHRSRCRSAATIVLRELGFTWNEIAERIGYVEASSARSAHKRGLRLMTDDESFRARVADLSERHGAIIEPASAS